MIPPLVGAGYRCVAPDLIGFGRSDKLARRENYSYQFHVDMMNGLVRELGLKGVTLFGQDWGGMIGMRVLVDNLDRFIRLVVANTGLPTGEHAASGGFMRWLHYSQTVENFHVGGIVKGGCKTPLSAAAIAAYNAPFPTDAYKEAARMFPMLVPTTPDNPASDANRRAWDVLRQWQGNVLTLFSDQDAVTAGGEKPFQKLPGAQGQPHATIVGGGHFLQEDSGPELAARMIEWMKR